MVKLFSCEYRSGRPDAAPQLRRQDALLHDGVLELVDPDRGDWPDDPGAMRHDPTIYFTITHKQTLMKCSRRPTLEKTMLLPTTTLSFPVGDDLLVWSYRREPLGPRATTTLVNHNHEHLPFERLMASSSHLNSSDGALEVLHELRIPFRDMSPILSHSVGALRSAK